MTRDALDELDADVDDEEQKLEIIRRRKDGSIPKFADYPDDAPQKLPPPIDPNNPGGRVFAARCMARVSRSNLEIASGLSRGHMTRIECGFRVCRDVFTLYAIIRGLRKYGVKIELEWIVFGTGKKPELVPAQIQEEATPDGSNNPGERVLTARCVARVPRSHLEIASGLSSGHLTRIECGARVCRDVFTLYAIIRGLAKYGVEIDMRWIVFGTGPDPKRLLAWYQRYPDEAPPGYFDQSPKSRRRS